MTSLIRQWRQRLATLGVRDRQVLALLAVFLTVAMVYFGLWQPVARNYSNGKALLSENRALAAWLRDNEAPLRRAGQRAANVATDGGTDQSLVAMVSASASGNQIAIARLEPNDSGVRVWIDATDFSRLIHWLNTLSTEHGVAVHEAVIERLAADRGISARLQLNLPGK